MLPEIILIIFAAGLIYYVATRVAPHGLIFKIKKEEETLKCKSETKLPEKEVDRELINEGESLFNKGALDSAEKKFLMALKSNPCAKEPYHFLGMIYLRQEMYKGAVATLEKACSIDPLNDTNFHNLGLAYYHLGNYEMAVKNYQHSLSLNDKIAHRHLNLALAHQKLKNLDKASVCLENAVKIHPNEENLTLLAKNYLQMEEKNLAEKTLEKLLEIDPGNTWAKRQSASLKN